jgi:hypothetical protein
MSHQTNNPIVKDTEADIKLISSFNNTENSLKSFLVKHQIIREIHSCLMPCNQCTGMYIDAISGKILRIICRHKCHSSNITK